MGDISRDSSGCERVSKLGNTDPNAGLAISRAIGDLQLHQCGVVHQPGTNTIDCKNDENPFIVVGSDGVWDMVEDQEVINITSRTGRTKASDAAEAIAKCARDRWIERSPA